MELPRRTFFGPLRAFANGANMAGRPANTYLATGKVINPLSREKGLALVDALAGMMILCIAVTCLVSASAAARSSINQSQWRLKASNAAAAKIEDLQSRPLPDLLNSAQLVPGDTVVQSSGDILLRTESAWLDEVAGLLRVKVTAEWQGGPATGHVALETVLGRRSYE